MSQPTTRTVVSAVLVALAAGLGIVAFTADPQAIPVTAPAVSQDVMAEYPTITADVSEEQAAVPADVPLTEDVLLGAGFEPIPGQLSGDVIANRLYMASATYVSGLSKGEASTTISIEVDHMVTVSVGDLFGAQLKLWSSEAYPNFVLYQDVATGEFILASYATAQRTSYVSLAGLGTDLVLTITPNGVMAQLRKGLEGTNPGETFPVMGNGDVQASAIVG